MTAVYHTNLYTYKSTDHYSEHISTDLTNYLFVPTADISNVFVFRNKWRSAGM